MSPGLSRKLRIAFLAVGVGVTLAGCSEAPRDGGSGRPWIGDKSGNYHGAPDQKLSGDQQRALRERAGLQH